MSAHESARILPAEPPAAPVVATDGRLLDVLRIAFPLICSSSAHAVKLFSDRAMVGWYSSTMLTASFLAGLLASVFIVAVLATGQYTGTFVAQYMGAGRPDRVGLAVWQGILFSVATGIILSLLGFFATPLLDYTGHEPILLAGEKSYFMVMLCMSGFSVGATAVASFWTGRGKPWMATGVTFVSLFLNVVFNWIFIFGDRGCQALANTPVLRHFGDFMNAVNSAIAGFFAPYAADGAAGAFGPIRFLAVEWGGRPLGIFGAAFATGLTEAMTFLIFLVLFLSPSNRRRFGTWPAKLFDPDLLRRLLRFGLPAGAQPFVDILTFFCFNYLLAEYGAAAGHAAAIAFSVNTLAFNPMLGMGGAATILVGQAIGGRHISIAKRVVRSTRQLLFGYVAVMAFIFVAYPDRIIAFFSEDRPAAATVDAEEKGVHYLYDEVVDAAPGVGEDESGDADEAAATRKMARRFLLFIGLWLIGDAMFILYSSAIRGAGDTSFAMKMIILMSIFLYTIPCAALHLINVKFELGWGPTPLWIVLMVYVYISGLLFYWRYRHGAWQRMRVIEE